MNLYEFEYGLSDEIINRYKRERELYNNEIDVLRQITSNSENAIGLNPYLNKLNYLIAKREQIRKAISALSQRKDPVYYYSGNATYKIIGSSVEYNQIHQGIDKARNIDRLIYSVYVNLKTVDMVYGQTLIGRHHHRKLIYKHHRLRKKSGKIQAEQRKIVLNQVELVGKKYYGVTHSVPICDNPKIIYNKSGIINRLKSFKRAVIVGYNEFKRIIKSPDPVYKKNNH